LSPVGAVLAPMRWQTEEVAVQKLAINAKTIAVDIATPPSSAPYPVNPIDRPGLRILGR
jgi:hypothetical protein